LLIFFKLPTVREFLKRVPRQSLSSLTAVINAYDACAKVIADVREEYNENSLQISPNIELAVWAKVRFVGDWEAFHNFVKKAVENYSPGQRRTVPTY